MLTDFAQERETFLTTKTVFQSPKKSAFPEGLTHAFGQKMILFSLVRLGQNKTRNNA